MEEIYEPIYVRPNLAEAMSDLLASQQPIAELINLEEPTDENLPCV
jgi:hypothetical protein